MKKENELLERIIALEKEVSELREEVVRLKLHTKLEEASVKKFKTQTISPTKEELATQKGKTVIPIAKIENKQDPATQNLSEPVTQKPKKEKRSLEETLTSALPKIFIVIFVLGVLWGLKLVSDYGILTDNLKIIGAYLLSVGLGICAFIIEKRKKGSRVVALSLYGGTFIVGILTTAAGAILYDVLSLYIALIIALFFIVYGVVISYLKGNEALTVLVVFTSLLLPYLLEYMDFSWTIIGIFVVLLFTVVQLVIFKHKQHNALFIGMFFSILALCIISGFHTNNIEFFAFTLVVLYSVFFISFLSIYRQENKWHASLLFSFTIITVSAINVMLMNKEVTLSIALFIVLGILTCVAYYLFKRGFNILFDITMTLAILTLLDFIAQMNISDEVIQLLLIIVTFAAVLLALKHAISFMKWMNSITFTILGIHTFIISETKPFFSIENITLLIYIAMIVGLYLLIRKWISHRSKSIQLVQNVFPILIYFAAFFYIWKVDIDYLPYEFTSYLVSSAIVVFFAAILMMKQHYVGKILPIIAAIFYGLTGLTLFSIFWTENEKSIYVSIMLRIIYLSVLWAILVDFWKQGLIFKNYSTLFKRSTIIHLTIVAFIISIFAIFSTSEFMYFNEIISSNFAVIMNTATVFIISFLSLFLAARTKERNLKLTGIGLLFFGIIKLIFFDLSELDLLIRSITFIIIGAIGLFVSNKLLAKGKAED